MKTKLGCLLTVVALLAGFHQAAAQDTTVFPIATNGAASQAGIFAAFGRTNYLVGIQGDGTTNYTAISAQLISTNGTLVGSRILPGRAGGIPYVAFGRTNFLLLWSDDALVASGGNDQVYGQFVTQSGTLVGSPFTFGPTSEEQDMQGGGGSLLAFDGKNYLAVWDTGGFHDSPGGDIHGALFNQIGSLVVPVIPITSETNGALTPTVTFGKTNYLVVWNNRRPSGPEEYDIYGEFISTNGTQGNAFVINQTPTPSYDPCCSAFDGTNFMVVWSKNIGSASPNTIWNLYGRVVSADGTFPGNEVAIVTDPNNPEVPSLAFDGANYLLAWNVGELSTNSQIVFQFFNPAASSIGSEFYLFSQQGTNRPIAGGMLFDGNRFEITAVVGGSTGTGSEGTDFTSSTGTYGTFLSTNPTASAALGYAYTTNVGGLTLSITGYAGPGGIVTTPGTINNLPVIGIATNAFYGNTSLTSVLIPNSVTNIGDGAFAYCINLTGIDFQGAPPSADSTAFNGDNYATAYYLPGAIGWSSTFAGISAVLSISDSLQVTITPTSAIAAGAQWQVDGGTWQSSGATVSNLSVGSHIVSFSPISGWTTPANQTVSASAPWTTTVLGTYPVPFNYTTSNGTITITSYTGSGSAATIPDTINNLPVTSIGPSAFQENQRLTSVTIPSSVTNIGEFAFLECTSLTNVYFEGDAPKVGFDVFDGEVPEPPYYYGATAYYLPGTTGWADFSASTGLPIEVLYAVTTNAGALTITYYFGPGGVVAIPATMAGLPVIGIGDNVFAGAVVTSVTIPGNVTSIGEDEFAYCSSLTNVTIGSSVTNIGEDAFIGCFSLMAITVDSGNLFYSSVNGVLFNQNQTTLIEFPNGPGGSYTIPMNVTSIESNAFFGCNLTSVTIGSGVTSIGEAAFGGSSLTAITVDPGNLVYSDVNGVLFDKDVTTLIQYPGGQGGSYTIPMGVTSIGAGAFDSCTELTGVTIPNSVTSIGTNAFAYCGSLTSVTIPNSVTNIGDDAFADCTSLSAVYFNGNAPAADSTIFLYDNPTAYYLPDTTGWAEFSTHTGLLTKDEYSYATNAGSITINSYSGPGGVVTIPPSITGLPVTGLADYAFEGAGLTSVTIPASVTNIGEDPFGGCSSLTTITLEAGNPDYSIVNGVLFGQNLTTLIQYPGGQGGSYIIPENVTNIGAGAFDSCTGLTSVTIGNNVTNIGDYAFDSCTGLTNVTIPNSVTSIGSNTFQYCTSLSSVTIPNSIATIGDYAFGFCTGLTSVTIGNNVTNIGDYTFDSCTGLTNVTIPNSVTSIGSGAFYQCGVTRVTIPASVTNIGEYAFFSCTRLTAITVDSGNLVYNSVNGVLFDASQTTLIQYPSRLGGSYIIPDSVTNIGAGAFDSCTSLTAVTIPNSITSIGDYAFSACTRLTSVTIPNSVTNIGQQAFEACSSLTNVSIGNSVTSIGFSAFSDCTSLTAVTIPASVTNIGEYAFLNCTSLTGIYFLGNAPVADPTVFYQDNNPTVYYLPNTTGWGETFAFYLPTALWRPTSLRVTINPVGAISAGAQWQVDEGTLQNGAVTAIYLPVGIHTVSFAPLSGWIAPGDQTFTITTFTITNGGAASVAGVYSLLPANLAGIKLSGANLTLNGIDGQSNGTYYLLTATNLALPLNQWTLVATNVLTASGNFTLTATNTVTPTVLQRFYILQPQYPPVTNPPAGMALVPAGEFVMGDTLDGESDAVPTNVYVSAFYMDTNLVSYDQWESVYYSPTSQGYGFDYPGSGKAANQPVQTVDWYDAVKWCNARSEQVGLIPVYYTDPGLTHVYTNGDVTPYPNWAANGYRLPTEAEWEKAARGALIGQRFPWGDTISGSQANYFGDSFYSYDLGPYVYNGFISGGYPYTSPVGYFAANVYGLYDMAGNVDEWCWDWYGTPYAGGSDPFGPASGSDRVLRGGDWGDFADNARCAYRLAIPPSSANYYFGFRCVRGH